MTNKKSAKTNVFVSGIAATALAVGSVVANTPIANAVAPNTFISEIAPMAQKASEQYQVPASVSIAQAILESGWGTSTLTTYGNAYFGIKCTSTVSQWQKGCTTMNTWEVFNGVNVKVPAQFRTYASGYDSFMDHGLFLRENSRYAPAFKTTTADDFARAIHTAGYATDPSYSTKLINLMDSNNLRSYDSGSSSSLTIANGVKTTYEAHGAQSVLGNATTNEISIGSNGEVVQRFDNGEIYWTKSTAGIWVHGGILTEYNRLGSYEVVGLPTSGEQSLGSGIVVQHFTNGDIYWSADTGAKWVHGGVKNRYNAQGGVDVVGLPTSSEISLGNQGQVVQHFTNGDIYWTVDNGGYWVHGGIKTKFDAIGATKVGGYPTSNEISVGDDGSVVQHFTNSDIYWSAEKGALLVFGGVRAEYNRLGAEEALGVPTSGEESVGDDGSVVQHFANGDIYWSASTGGKAVSGDMLTDYNIRGGVEVLGLPTSSQTTTSDGKIKQSFENGDIVLALSQEKLALQNIRIATNTSTESSSQSANASSSPSVSASSTPSASASASAVASPSVTSTTTPTPTAAATSSASTITQATATSSTSPSLTSTATASPSNIASDAPSASSTANPDEGASEVEISELGEASSELISLSDGNSVQHFEKGDVYKDADGISYIVQGSILDTFNNAGGYDKFGMPTSKQTGRRLIVQSFERGQIYIYNGETKFLIDPQYQQNSNQTASSQASSTKSVEPSATTLPSPSLVPVAS